MIWLTPILILGISMCNIGLVVSTPPLWWGIALTTLVLVLLLAIKRTNFCGAHLYGMEHFLVYVMLCSNEEGIDVIHLNFQILFRALAKQFQNQ